MKEHMRAGLDELRRHGLAGRYEFGGKHPRLAFEAGGRSVAILCSLSPRCAGVAAKKLRLDVRKALGDFARAPP